MWNSNDTLGGTIGTDYDILFTTSGSDTDGDSYSDGIAVLAGTDPLDPQDFPPPPVPVSGPWGIGVLAQRRASRARPARGASAARAPDPGHAISSTCAETERAACASCRSAVTSGASIASAKARYRQS